MAARRIADSATFDQRPATVCVRKWDRFGDWHYFTGMSAAAMHARNPRESDVRLSDEYFYDYNV